MFRLTFFLAGLALVGMSCSPCARVANAEASVSVAGKACMGTDTTWANEKVSRCETGLSKCSADDLKFMAQYADCLLKISACTSSTGFSYLAARAGCLADGALKISPTCFAAIQ